MGPVDSAADKARAPDEWAADDGALQSVDQQPLDRRDSLSPNALRERIDQLPPGHPSSPYDADGSLRQPIPRLRDLETFDEEEHLDNDRQSPDLVEEVDRHVTPDDPVASPDRQPPDIPPEPDAPRLTDETRPLTDTEWTEHVSDVRSILGDADAKGLATESQFTTDEDQEQWTPARDRIQGDLVAELYERSSHVPLEGMAIVAGGLSGAGKTTILSKYAGIDLSQYLIINPDNIKEEMASRGLIPEVEGLSPMEASDLVHEESSVIAKQLARKAASDGKNIIWDITMSTRESTERRINDLREAGYTVDGIFIDIPVEVSIRRTDARHREGHNDYHAGIGFGGRYVPTEVIKAQADPDWGSKNRKTFEYVNHFFDHWSRYDNSVDGRQPVLVQTDLPDDRNRQEKA
jgi:predicted kinase